MTENNFNNDGDLLTFFCPECLERFCFFEGEIVGEIPICPGCGGPLVQAGK